MPLQCNCYLKFVDYKILCVCVFGVNRGAHILGTRSPGEFYMVASNMYVSSVWNVLHVTLLAPGILRWLVASWKICALLGMNVIMKQKVAEWAFELSSDSTLKVISAISCWDCMSLISGWTNMNHWWNGGNRKTEVCGTEPVSLGSPQMLCGLAWDWI
jgi:hypothetical protein